MKHGTPAFLIAVAVACRGGQRFAPSQEAGAESPAPAGANLESPAPAGASVDAGAVQRAGILSARCAGTEGGVALGDASAGSDVEIGEAVSFGPGRTAHAVGLLRRTASGTVGAVALLAGDAAGSQLVDLGSTLGDAPPPRLSACGDALVAAALEGRSLVLTSVAPRLERAFASIPQRRDDSLAFDVACSGESGLDVLAVWDESSRTADGGVRGVIRAASSRFGQPASAVRDLSPTESDVEAPRVVQRNGAVAGFYVLWLAHRPEPSGSPDAATDFEAPGEARSYGWVEMIAVDGAGKVSGGPRPLTSASGHVSAYDVRPAVFGSGVVVVARDDGEATDGAGGVILRVRAGADGVEPPLALVTDGLGRGAPGLVEASRGLWLTWVGPHEQLRILPLDAAGNPSGAPSLEEALDEARPLMALGPQGRMLVATPRDGAAPLRVFACRE